MRKNNHTLTKLPKDAKEYKFSPELLRAIDAAGYCVNRAKISNFICWIKTIIKNKKHLDKEITKFQKWANNLPKNINYICIFPNSSLRKSKNKLLSEVKITSLRNHERFHAQTLRYNYEWYEIADSILTNRFGKLWTDIAKQIAELDCHEDLLDEQGYSWVAVAETIARVCAILHAKPKYRRHVAEYQLREHSTLLRFAKEFEKIYENTEKFVEIMSQLLKC